MYRKLSVKVALLSVFSALSVSAYSQPVAKHQVVAPPCLTKHLTAPYHTLSTTNSLSLVEVDQAGLNQLVELKHTQRCGGFMDVSHAWETYTKKSKAAATKPGDFLKHYTKPSAELGKRHTYKIQYESVVNQQLQNINFQTMWDNLNVLSNDFEDRYSNSENGVKAANWIKAKIEEYAKTYNRKDITIRFVQTGDSYKQPSVVVKMGNSTQPGVVIGGHMDTLASTFENKPGADDDGTGTVTVLETARTLIASGLEFKKPIYFIWYAAEEMGLVGSQYVVEDFVKKHIPVDAVMQFDMTGYAHKNDLTMWLLKDNVSKNLTKFTESLIDTYVKRPYKFTACGYACSDHASWNNEGFPAAMPFEASFETDNPYIHSSNDTIDNLTLNHMMSFSKLATSFAIELAEPV
jgi:leucyl aminopeptidase